MSKHHSPQLWVGGWVWQKALNFKSTRLIHLWVFGQCLSACSYLWSSCTNFTDEDEPKSLSWPRQMLCKLWCSQINFVCVWYRCRSDRRQRKCSRANGVHSLQRILPGEQKRKIKQTNLHWHPPSETPLSLCAVSGRKLEYQLLAGYLKSFGSQKCLVQVPQVLDGGEYISEIFLKEITWSRWIHWSQQSGNPNFIFVT